MEKRGEKTPLSQQPKNRVDIVWYLEAFQMISNGRNSDSPITLAEIRQYVEMFGIIDPLDVFIRNIQAMDKIFLKEVNKEVAPKPMTEVRSK